MAGDRTIVCASCRGPVALVGPVPPSAMFSGRVLTDPPAPASLYRCQTCHLVFKHPVPEIALLNEWYASGDSETWTAADADRADWATARSWIGSAHADGVVLDVGCFDGGFASGLPAGIRRFGVEIHPEAARRAALERGVDIVAADYSELAATGRTFDCVTAFDVIEHVHDPRRLLGTLASAVEPGGSVIVGTGNADAWTWRLMRGGYWYCWYLEHIAFISPRWARAVAAPLGLRIERIERLSRGDRRRFLRELANNVAYLLLPRRFTAMVRRRIHRLSGRDIIDRAAAEPPAWVSARDHILIWFRRTEDADVTPDGP